MFSIRSAARALIIEDEKILAIKMQNADTTFFILPGGGQHHGETLTEALERECLEELGIKITILKLLYTREYIGKNHEFDTRHHEFHQIEHVFECTLADKNTIGKGHDTDKRQIGFEWIPIAQLEQYPLLPKYIKPFLKNPIIQFPNIYLVDIN